VERPGLRSSTSSKTPRQFLANRVVMPQLSRIRSLVPANLARNLAQEPSVWASARSCNLSSTDGPVTPTPCQARFVSGLNIAGKEEFRGGRRNRPRVLARTDRTGTLRQALSLLRCSAVVLIAHGLSGRERQSERTAGNSSE